MSAHSAKVTAKGQITLPVELRKELGLKAGDRVEFQRNNTGKFEIAARTKSIMDLRGSIGGFNLSAEDIVDAVDRARTDRAHELARRIQRRAK